MTICVTTAYEPFKQHVLIKRERNPCRGPVLHTRFNQELMLQLSNL